MIPNAGAPPPRSPAAKLTAAAVRAILASPESSYAIAKRYGVTPATIGYVRRGETHRHLGGTPQDRRAIGEAHPNAKLSADDVRAIRASAEDYAELARRYGVSTAHIHNVRSGRTWRHLKDA